MRLAFPLLLLALWLGLVAPATAGDRSDFEKAQKQDTVEGYHSFVNSHKLGTKYTTAAFQRIDELEFEHASSVDTLEAWYEFVKLRISGPADAEWPERSRRALESIDRLTGEQVRSAQRAALAAPSWDNFQAFWDRYPWNMTGSIAAELPQLRYELAQAVGTWRAYALYEKEYPGSELTARLKHEVMYKDFEAKPSLFSALAYLRVYPQGEHSAQVRAWLDADQSAARAGSLRVRWVGGKTMDSVQIPTGEMIFRATGPEPVYKTLRPKQGVFQVAEFMVFNLGEPRRLAPSQVVLGDGKSRRFAAFDLVAPMGNLVVIASDAGVNLNDAATTVRAIFDVPRAGRESLRLYLDGTATLRIAEMPPQ